MAETAIKIEAICAVTGLSSDALFRRIRRGEVPPPDVQRHRNDQRWTLKALQNWNPQVADKIATGIRCGVIPARLI